MASSEFSVRLSVAETERIICEGIVRGSVTGELLDRHEVRGGGGAGCVILVFEKHFMRAGNRLSLTVAIDDYSGKTRVHCVGGGGGEGLFRFDWGASESFANAPYDLLRGYLA